MSQEILDMEARIKDYVSNNIDKIESKIKTLDTTTKTTSQNMAKNFAIANNAVMIGVQAAAIGIRKLNTAVGDSISKAKEQIDSEERVKAALISTAGAAGVTFSEMESLAKGLQKVTTVGDETILRGESMLLTFTNIGKNVIPQATETMLNLSVAMRTDVQQSAIQLGKALNDPITGVTALRRVGVQLTDQQEDQIKKLVELGKLEEAQKIILDELQTEFGGLARKIAETDSGQIEQLNNQIGDMQEKLGKELLPLTKDWLSVLLEISKVTIPFLTDAAQGWGWLLGGKEQAENKVNELNTINQELQGLIRLQNEWKEVEQTQLALKAQKGSLFNEETLNEAILNLETIHESINELTQKGNEIRGVNVSSSVSTKTTGGNVESSTDEEKILQAKIERLTEEVKFEEEIAKYINDIESDLREEKKEAEETLKELNLEYDQEILDSKLALREAEIAGISDALEQELALLDLKYEQEQVKYEDNQIALAAIKEKYDLQRQQAEDKHIQRQIKENRRLEKERVSQIEGVTGYTMQALDLVSKSSKENSSLQKGIDIAQATANVFLGVTKAISQERFWEIPFILGLGFAQVAQISAQKYAIGGYAKNAFGVPVPGNTNTGDRIPALLNSGEMISTRDDQRMLLDAIRNPSSVDNSQSVSLNINLGAGATYDMAAAQYTVDQLTPIIGDVLTKAKNEGRLVDYESSR